MVTAIETYEQAIEYLFGRINYERSQPDNYSTNDFKLDRMRYLLEALGDPQLQLPAIHVAGTKGKGSTCSMLSAVLTQAGCRPGLYTSPHLVRFEERMRVDGVMPTPAELVALVNRLQPAVASLDRSPARMHPTYFEIATALAWLDFIDRGARVAILETGLGGRLDSTNVCAPWVSVITNVSRDHTQILGSTVRQIASEKAGIIKKGVPVVCGCQHPDAIATVVQTAKENSAPLWLLDREIRWHWHDESRREIDVKTPRRTWERIPVPLSGEHQAINTALVLATLDALPAAAGSWRPETVRAGLQATQWPARVEVMSRDPLVILDAAHNWASAKALVATLQKEFPARRRLLVFACSRDKDYRGLVRLLAPEFDSVIFTRYVDNPRAVAPEELRRYLEAALDRPSHLAPEPVAAWKLARRLAHSTDQIVITGSLFLAAELRDVLVDECRQSAPAARTEAAVATAPLGTRPKY